MVLFKETIHMFELPIVTMMPACAGDVIQTTSIGGFSRVVQLSGLLMMLRSWFFIFFVILVLFGEEVT